MWVLIDENMVRCSGVLYNVCRLVAIASSADIRIYSFRDGALLKVLKGHSAPISSLCINPRNSLQLVSSALDGKLIVWDYADGVAVDVHDVGTPILTAALFADMDYVALSLLINPAVSLAGEKEMESADEGQEASIPASYAADDTISCCASMSSWASYRRNRNAIRAEREWFPAMSGQETTGEAIVSPSVAAGVVSSLPRSHIVVYSFGKRVCRFFFEMVNIRCSLLTMAEGDRMLVAAGRNMLVVCEWMDKVASCLVHELPITALTALPSSDGLLAIGDEEGKILVLDRSVLGAAGEPVNFQGGILSLESGGPLFAEGTFHPADVIGPRLCKLSEEVLREGGVVLGEERWAYFDSQQKLNRLYRDGCFPRAVHRSIGVGRYIEAISVVSASSLLRHARILHWHAHAVLDLVFSQRVTGKQRASSSRGDVGNELVSVGEESVLMRWSLRTGAKHPRPRLGGALRWVAVGGGSGEDLVDSAKSGNGSSSASGRGDGRSNHGGARYVVVTLNNSVRFISGESNRVSHVVRGLQSGCTPVSPLVTDYELGGLYRVVVEGGADTRYIGSDVYPWLLGAKTAGSVVTEGSVRSPADRAICHPSAVDQMGFSRSVGRPLNNFFVIDKQSHAVVVHAQPGHLQWYDLHSDRHQHLLDVCRWQFISRRNDTNHCLPHIQLVALSSTGFYLVTYHVVDDSLVTGTVDRSLCFWKCIEGGFSPILAVESPHGDIGVVALHITADGSAVFSVSTLGEVKVWARLQTDTDSTVIAHILTCSYHAQPCTATAFHAGDGSVLAVAQGSVVSVWNVETGKLIDVLEPMSGSAVRHLSFVEGAPLLVAATDKAIRTYSLLTMAAVWTVPVSVSCLTTFSIRGSEKLGGKACVAAVVPLSNATRRELLQEPLVRKADAAVLSTCGAALLLWTPESPVPVDVIPCSSVTSGAMAPCRIEFMDTKSRQYFVACDCLGRFYAFAVGRISERSGPRGDTMDDSSHMTTSQLAVVELKKKQQSMPPSILGSHPLSALHRALLPANLTKGVSKALQSVSAVFERNLSTAGDIDASGSTSLSALYNSVAYMKEPSHVLPSVAMSYDDLIQSLLPGATAASAFSSASANTAHAETVAGKQGGRVWVASIEEA